MLVHENLQGLKMSLSLGLSRIGLTGPLRAPRLTCRVFSTNPEVDVAPSKPEGTKPGQLMSTAMRKYLERKRSYDTFIANERAEFELGKKHLANMMGFDPDEMTQEKVDQAIEYLFPSGLEDKASRPLMKAPEEVQD